MKCIFDPLTQLPVVRQCGTWGKDEAGGAMVSFALCKQKFPSLWGYGLPSSLPCSATTNLHGQVLAPVFLLLCGCCHARLERGETIPASYFCHAVHMAQGLGGPVIYL